MRTLRAASIALIVAICAALALPVSALAGGWAVVTLDTLPVEPRAGQSLRLGFMVRQHGVTPIDSIYGQGAPMVPVLSARNGETGETIQVDARKEGPVGHFVVEVAFPSAGAWEWMITPPPFEGTKFEPLAVLPAAAVEPQAASVAAPEPVAAAATVPEGATAGARAIDPVLLRGLAIALLVGAIGLALARFRLRGPSGAGAPSARGEDGTPIAGDDQCATRDRRVGMRAPC